MHKPAKRIRPDAAGEGRHRPGCVPRISKASAPREESRGSKLLITPGCESARAELEAAGIEYRESGHLIRSPYTGDPDSYVIEITAYEIAPASAAARS